MTDDPARPSEEGLEFDEEDEQALDAVWKDLRREFPNYRASPETIERLKRLPAERAERYATLPPYEERRRRADEIRREAGFDPE